jgi:peroxiredoxin
MFSRRLALVALLAAAVVPVKAADMPRPAPDFAVQTGPNKYIWVADYSGKTLVLAFILTDCSHCQFTTGLLKNIQKDYAAKGVEVLQSAIETMSALHVADFVKKMGVTWPVGYNDQNYAAKFLGFPDNEPLLMPQIVFIDRRGIIRRQFAGDDPGLANAIQDQTLRTALDETLKAGAAPARSGAGQQTKKVQ